MAIQSKIKSPSTKPKQAAPAPEERKAFYCCRCEKKYIKQKGNYPASQSPLYKGNGGYLATCNRCVDELFQHYKSALEDEPKAIRRMCLKFDMYWHPEIYAMLNKANTSQSRIRSYISRANLIKYVGKTYDDTLDEEFSSKQEEIDEAIIKSIEELPEIEEVNIDPAVIEFWGVGFDIHFYQELDRKYKYWTGEIDHKLDKGEEALYKQICILEASINRDIAKDKPVERNVNTLNTLLGSINMKPSQKKQEDASDATFDSTPFGVGIRMYENTRPIPEADPEFKDTDGIVRYISIWFLGHLCKMLGIKNTYSKLYEQEIEKLRVTNPEYEEDDDETFFNNIFGDEV